MRLRLRYSAAMRLGPGQIVTAERVTPIMDARKIEQNYRRLRALHPKYCVKFNADRFLVPV